MSISHLLTQSVTIQRAGTRTDGVGDTQPDWSTPVETEVLGWLTQLSASEVLGNRDAQVSDWRLFLPADTTINAGDRVVANGITYEVDGLPANRPTPRGPHHLEAALHAVVG